ncbi:MAG: HK97 gp10 family phage protein [Desulfarculus sp.]|nr:HK97 gp10 family phage protein [Desulfarculus sp.]
MSAVINLKGFAELAANLESLPVKLARKYLRQAVLAGAVVVRSAARENAPVGSMPHYVGKKKFGVLAQPGNLRKTVVARSSRGDPWHRAVYQVGVNKRGFYGKFSEFGTSNMSARPWLRPAFDGNIQQVIEAVRKKLEAALTKEGLR